jgi:hypothetical protein
LPLPTGVACFAVAATLGSVPAAPGSSAALDAVLGDGLVPVASALGQNADPARSLAFGPHRQWVVAETGHIALMHSPLVCAQLLRWLA